MRLHEYINKRLDLPLFNEYMELNKFSKREVKRLFIDDLITSENHQTIRLRKIVDELKKDYKNEYKQNTY